MKKLIIPIAALLIILSFIIVSFFTMYGKFQLYYVKNNQWISVSGYSLKPYFYGGFFKKLDDIINYNNKNFKRTVEVDDKNIEIKLVEAYLEIKNLDSYSSDNWYYFYTSSTGIAVGQGDLSSYGENSYDFIFDHYK